MRHSETNLSLQFWQWYNEDPNTHMRIRSDVTTLSTIAGACNSGINPSLQLWQWYNADPNMHMRIRSDVTTLSIIALTARRFSKT